MRNLDVILNVDAISPPLTGIGRYALELARGLARHEAIGELRYFAGYRWVEHPDAALKSNSALASIRRNIPLKSVALDLYFRARQLAFSRLTSKMRGFVMHSPNYLLLKHDGPTVATIHDLSWLHYPEYHPVERVRAMNREMPRTFERATKLVTDSGFVRGELIERFGIEPSRVVAVPLGADESYAPRTEAECAGVLANFKLGYGRYLLSVATLEPRKNLERLLEAFARLPEAVRRQYPLAIAGVRGWHAASIERSADALERRGELVRLGYVDEADLPTLFAGARAFAFVSLYEGFGLPPLEAMKSGIPVLVGRGSAVSEVTGGAALEVDPLDVEAISAGLARVLDDDAWRDAARLRGLERATHYGWPRCVDETVAVYRSVAR